MRQVMKAKVLVVALCLGLVTASLVYMFLAKQAEEARSLVSVVTGRQNIPNGTIVEPRMLVVRAVPKNIIPPGAIVSPDAAVGKVTTRKISKGEPIPSDAISVPNRLAYIVPPFMRAVTVAVDPVIGVAGFLQPGDHVDVLATFTVNDGTVTTTVLQNVQLLATGNQVGQPSANAPNETAKSSTLPNATLAVSPSDAQKLVLADTRGKIRLVLRRPDDSSYVRVAGTTGRTIVGVVPPDVPKAQSPQAAKAAATPEGADKQLAAMVIQALQQAQRQAVQPAVTPVVPARQVVQKPQAVMNSVQVIRGTTTQEVTVPN